MRPLIHRSLALSNGAIVAAVTYAVAGWHVAAVGTGLLYTAAFGLLFRTHEDLRSRVDAWNDTRASLWSGAWGGLVALAASLVITVLSLPDGEGLAIGLVVFGAGTVGLATGVGMTLAYIDRVERDRVSDSSEASA